MPSQKKAMMDPSCMKQATPFTSTIIPPADTDTRTYLIGVFLEGVGTLSCAGIPNLHCLITRTEEYYTVELLIKRLTIGKKNVSTKNIFNKGSAINFSIIGRLSSFRG